MKTRLFLLSSLATLAAAVVVFSTTGIPLTASAQQGVGKISGQVVWGQSYPVAYGAPAQPGFLPEALPDETVPDASPGESPTGVPEAGVAQAWPGVTVQPPIVRPPLPRVIPAGAVLVAVQGTTLSARTDEDGRFEIGNVPAGQYFTVAAGPVRGTSGSFAIRPNVSVAAGGTAQIGRLYLGQPYGYGGPYPLAPGAADSSVPEEMP